MFYSSKNFRKAIESKQTTELTTKIYETLEII